jgi:phytoene dehydrogenase-like protein
LERASRQQYDVIIIGAGHNGLTAAATLAKRGRRVLLLEQREQTGGMSAGEEFCSGYVAPGVLHDTSGVRHGLIRSLKLERYGLELNTEPPSIYAPEKGGRGLLLHHDAAKAGDEISRFTAHDAEQYEAFREFVGRVGTFVNGLLDDTPPAVFGATGGSVWPLVKRALALRKLGKSDMMELLRVIPMCAADWLGEWFKTDLLKALLAGPSIYGTFMGPWSPGSAFNLLAWECRKGPLIKGGGVALVTALENAAKAYGAEIRTGAPVDGIVMTDGKVTGVSVNGDEVIEGKVVAAACDPKQVLLDLVPSSSINQTLRHRIKTFRSRGVTAKVNVALNARVELAGRPGELVEIVRTGESLDDLEKAFDPIKYGRYADRPHLEVYMPAATDSACAPEGHSVLSILVHFVPHELETRWNYRAREALGETVVETLSDFAPRIKDTIQSIEVLTPVELESRYAVTEGHIHHGEHALDQLLVRPSPECARYATPIEGLYLCGSGSHPGGGITCAPGALGAKAILENS